MKKIAKIITLTLIFFTGINHVYAQTREDADKMPAYTHKGEPLPPAPKTLKPYKFTEKDCVERAPSGDCTWYRNPIRGGLVKLTPFQKMAVSAGWTKACAKLSPEDRKIWCAKQN